MRFGSTGDPLTWYISQPAKCGPLMSHFCLLPSDSRRNAPFRVPTKTRTPLISHLLGLIFLRSFLALDHPGNTESILPYFFGYPGSASTSRICFVCRSL